MSKRADGKMTYLIGISRSGKTVYLFRQLEKRKRVIVWDPKGQYCQRFKHKKIIRVENPAQLAAAVQKNKSARWIAFVSSNPKDFEAFCYFAFNWGKQAPCTVVAEELAAVTNAGKATGYWGRLLNQALEYEIDIFATAQRAKEADKTIFSNVSEVVLFRTVNPSDRAYLVEHMGIEDKQITKEKLKYLKWQPDGSTRTGRLTF